MNAAGFIARIDKTNADGCWLWTGARMSQGYGNVLFKGRHHLAHRVAYELFIGPIPEGLHIDHLCHQPSECTGGPGCKHRLCLNPQHLQAVTNRENASPARSSHPYAFRNGKCRRGHDITDPANVDVIKKRGTRRCLACSRSACAQPATVCVIGGAP